jgi:hypothetical protein
MSMTDAQSQIHAALASLAAEIGPWEVGEDGDPIEGTSIDAAALSEWVVVMHWVDEGGNRFSTRVTSEGLPKHHEDGLLFNALHRFD